MLRLNNSKQILTILVISLLIISFVIIIFFIKNNSTGKDDQDNTSANINSNNNSVNCVPASCAHSTSCVLKDHAPNCTGLFFTQECSPNTTDCGQGSCKFIEGKCKLIFENDAKKI